MPFDISAGDWMLRPTVFTKASDFAKEFDRCCRTYRTLHIVSAWAGTPTFILPFSSLRHVKGRIRATIGIAFDHTHPDAITLLQELGAEVRIFRDHSVLFHPKAYLFGKPHAAALFVGSSNLTYGGFYQNVETNILLEGTLEGDDAAQLRAMEENMLLWHSPAHSLRPTARWLATYRERYQKAERASRQSGQRTPPHREEEIASASRLRHADWPAYYEMVIEGLGRQDRSLVTYMAVLDAARQHVPLPWQTAYFADIANRRIIGGIGEYGCLGHVAASGDVRHLLAAGTPAQQQSIVEGVNAAGALHPPLNWSTLEAALQALVRIGPTIKVWSRLLCITRPDIYCTVASQSVRAHLSETLEIPKSAFEKVPGYIMLLKLVHSAPWYNSPEPPAGDERDVWRNRAAFLDAIFY